MISSLQEIESLGIALNGDNLLRLSTYEVFPFNLNCLKGCFYEQLIPTNEMATQDKANRQ